jgi:hypothetical protein
MQETKKTFDQFVIELNHPTTLEKLKNFFKTSDLGLWDAHTLDDWCDDCDPADMGHCDDCEQRMPDEPRWMP